MIKKLLVIGTMLLLLFGFSGQSMARIHVGVSIPLPPVFVFSAPPELVVIPGTYVYYCPDVDVDVFFFGGYWYRPYGGYWYRSVSYDGPWVYIESAPSVLLSLPPNFRVIARGERHIPYAELHTNWRAWERDRYWEHHNWGRTERGRMEHQTEHGLAPSYRERERGGSAGGVQGRTQREPQHGSAPSLRERGHSGSAGGVQGRTQHQTEHGLAPSFRERGNSGSAGGVQHGRAGTNGGGGARGGTSSQGGGGHERR